MKKFLRNTAIFALMVIAFFLAAEYYVEKNSYKHDSIAWIAKKINERHDSIQTIFIGTSFSSRINEKMWGPEALNVAVAGCSMECEYYSAMEIIPRLENLKNIYIEISYHTFHDDRAYRPDFVGFVGWYRPTIYLHTKKFSKWSKYNWELFDAMTFRRKIINDFHYDGEEDQGRQLQLPEVMRDEKTRMENAAHWARDYTNVHSPYVARNLQLLEGIIQLAQERNIEVNLYSTPILEDVRKLFDARQLAEFHAIATGLEQKYNLKFYDYMAAPRFVLEDYYDCTHLNYGQGGTKFTQILKNDVTNDTRRTDE